MVQPPHGFPLQPLSINSQAGSQRFFPDRACRPLLAGASQFAGVAMRAMSPVVWWFFFAHTGKCIDFDELSTKLQLTSFLLGEASHTFVAPSPRATRTSPKASEPPEMALICGGRPSNMKLNGVRGGKHMPFVCACAHATSNDLKERTEHDFLKKKAHNAPHHSHNIKAHGTKNSRFNTSRKTRVSLH